MQPAKNDSALYRPITTGANGVILVYSIDSRSSFEKLQFYYDEAVRSVSIDKVAFIVIGNKSDLQARREVSFDQGQAFAAKYNIPFFEVSAKDLSNLPEMVEAIYNSMYMKQWESGANGPCFKSKYTLIMPKLPF